MGLGFEIDDAGLAKFNKSLASAAVKVTALYVSINAMAGAIVKNIADIAEGFEQMGYEYHLIAPAINKALVLRQELLRAYSAAGINITKTIKNSIDLNMSLTKTKYALEAIYKSVGSRFFTLITKQSDLFRKQLYQFMPKIQATLERFVKFIFKAFEAVTTLGVRIWSILTRVYDFFVELDKATDGWSTVILGVAAAWKLLNLSFLATPLGMILTGFAALLTLWDDFKTFKEGGQSLINWGSETTKVIVGITTVIAALGATIGAVILGIKAWAIAQGIINALLLLNPIGLWITGITALIALLTALAVKMGYLKGLGASFGGIGESVMNFLGGKGATPNVQNNPIGQPMANPIGAGNHNNSTNQNVRQQTNINIMGSSDANATGAAVANQQGKVNQDMTRNLKGATR